VNLTLSRSLFGLSALGLLIAACFDSGGDLTGASSGGQGGDLGVGPAVSVGGTTSGAGGSSGSGGALPAAEAILAELRADTTGALAKHAALYGWPVPVLGGFLFVSTDLGLPLLSGDHDGWAGTPMKPDTGFLWLVLEVPAGDKYKFTDKTTFQADPWARAYSYDGFGELSLVKPATAHLERWRGVKSATLEPRTVRVWVPEGPVTHELYAEDGQNLFDPGAPWGGWHLEHTAPPGMLIVGIDNTPGRIDEYTHVSDVIGGKPMGGQGDAYADLLENVVRPLVRAQYGEPGPIGLMGSSLGGLISLHIADRAPGTYAFAASLSGTMGFGSIGPGVHNQTMIERYKAHGHQKTVLYVDSGGDGPCGDADGDGIDDDSKSATDNYCENLQLRGVLGAVGYQEDKDFFYGWKKGELHNEAAWAGRVSRPLQIFAALR
jgi:Putative esterase